VSDDVLVSSPPVALRAPRERSLRPGRFVFLDALRAVAVGVVIYSHVVGIFLHQHHDSSTTANVIQGFAGKPLVLALNLGNFGVVVFFLVSGFIVTHTGYSETTRQYAIKRFLRIYPMLVVGVLLSSCLFLVGLHPVTTGESSAVTPLTVFTNATLVNNLIAPMVVLVVVTWTLIIEVLFYSMLLVALPLMRRKVWPVIAGELALVAVIMASEHLVGPTSSWFLIAVNVSYLPALLIGQAVWAVWSRHVPLWAGAVFAIVAWIEYVWAGNPGMGRNDHIYDHNLLLGIAVFLIALLLESKLRPLRWVGWLADRSYSLYLLHGLLAFAVMNLLYPRIGFLPALAVGVAITLLGADLGFRFVERPSMRLARRLAKRWAPSGVDRQVASASAAASPSASASASAEGASPRG
jgi:peptidoglycan/LPS O-acetylase OafA/YrhL